MKILIAGATGKTGRRLVKQLLSEGHQPVAMVRNSSDTSSLPPGIETRTADLTRLPDDVCRECDSVIFAAGSGGDTDKEMTKRVDRDGAKSLVDLAAKRPVERFVMLSSVGAESPDSESEMSHYLQAKHEADEHLKKSGLEYAIVRPVALTDDEGSRSIRYGEDVDPQGKAARGDVAAVLAAACTSVEWKNRTARMESA